MFLKRFCIKKSFIRQGLFLAFPVLAFIGSVSFNVLNADELKECKSEEDQEAGCIAKQYDENGNLEIEVPYKNGKREGISKNYYENGNLWGETPYKNGVIEGVGKTYYESGKLMEETPYKNGKRDGISKDYYENGNLWGETPYKNGKIDGIAKLYYENGNMLSEITYMNDEVHGSVKFYSKKLIWQANAQNGKLINGKCTNGKTLTDEHLAKINEDINEGNIDEDSWLEMCNN